jgi:hypothetical protein
MKNLIRFKSLIEILSVSSLILIIFSFYYTGIYLALYDSIVDIGTLLDVSKWQRFGRV